MPTIFISISKQPADLDKVIAWNLDGFTRTFI